MVEYGYGVWRHSADLVRERRTLRSCERVCSTVITRAYKDIDRQAAYVLMGVPPLDVHMAERFARRQVKGKQAVTHGQVRWTAEKKHWQERV